MKKSLSLMLIFVLLLLPACGTNDRSGTENGNAESDERVTVKLAVWASGAADNFAKGAEEFNKRQNKINFVIDMQTSYTEYLGAKVASNDLPDLFFLNPYSEVQQFARNGKILDLSDRKFNDHLYDSMKASGTYEGKMYALPMVLEMLGIYYNQDLFKEAGIEKVPETFDEMKEAVDKLNAKNITPFAATFKDSWTLMHMLSTLQGAILGDDMDDWIADMNAGKGTYDVEGSNRVYEFLDLIKENSGKNYMDADSTTGFNTLANGEAAMLLSGEFALLNLSSINPDLPVGLFAVPVTDNSADAKLDVDVGISIAVNKDSKNLEAALEVLDYISDNNDKNGWFHLVSDSLGSPPPAMPFEMTKEYPYFKDYTNYMNAGKVRGWNYLQLPSGFGGTAGETIQGYMMNGLDSKQTMQALDNGVKELLQ